PTVTSISPEKGPAAGGTEVTIKGSGFLAGVKVTIGSSASVLKVLSESEIKATTTAAPPGPEEVIVEDARGVSSSGPTYTYLAAPTLETKPASAITQTTATLNATVNPNGSEVSKCEFQYGETMAYGKTAPCSLAPGSGITPVAVSASISGLAAD